MATQASTSDPHQTCKTIQYRKDIRIEELEAENARLRHSLEVPVATTNGARAASISEDLQPTYEELFGRYRNLERQFDDCDKSAREARRNANLSYERYKLYKGKYERYRQYVLGWQAYYDRCKRSQADEARIRQSPTVNNDSTSGSPISKDSLCAGTNLDIAQPDTVCLKSLAAPVTLPPLSLSKANPTNRLDSATEGGSDSTECPSSPPVKHEPSSDDTPVVVSARSVKRKRSDSERAMPPPVRIKHESNSPNQDTGLASGFGSVGAISRWTLARHQTSDLDALADKLATPRKPKASRVILAKESSQPRSVVMPSASLSTGETPQAVKVEHIGSFARGVAPPVRRTPCGVNMNGTIGHVLRDLDVNSISKRTGLRPRPVKTSDRSFDEAADKIHMLSEDGQDDFGKDVRPVKDNGGSQQLRLNSILDLPTPDQCILRRSSTPERSTHHSKIHAPCRGAENLSAQTQSVKLQPFSALSPNVNSRRKALAPKANSSGPRPQQQHSSERVETKRPRKPPGLDTSPPPIEPEDEPLRSRRAASLRLEDFRINPKYMGSEYAWADTLRGRDQRRCLPGCTKPDCCGDAFMSFADIGASSRSDRDDTAVLEAHLGPDWPELMGAFPAQKRAQILKQARAASLANQFGKHRQAFERRSTPPGFWRTDMPSTQEAEQDSAKAREMVREKVEERRREAMREGGRWLFRDE